MTHIWRHRCLQKKFFFQTNKKSEIWFTYGSTCASNKSHFLHSNKKIEILSTYGGTGASKKSCCPTNKKMKYGSLMEAPVPPKKDFFQPIKQNEI